MKKYVIDHGCKKCCSCLWACPAQAISLTRDTAVIDQTKCRHCGACLESCPTEAISVSDLPAVTPPASANKRPDTPKNSHFPTTSQEKAP